MDKLEVTNDTGTQTVTALDWYIINDYPVYNTIAEYYVRITHVL